MKVVIGDMNFQEDVPICTPASWDDSKGWDKYHELQDRLKANLEVFLVVAKECYIARYGVQPERTTKDEF